LTDCEYLNPLAVYSAIFFSYIKKKKFTQKLQYGTGKYFLKQKINEKQSTVLNSGQRKTLKNYSTSGMAAAILIV
jgi:hypothetical protein